MKEFLEKLVADADIANAIDAEYQRRVRCMGAEAAVKEAVAAAGGRNLKAIRALLDENGICQAEDMAAAAKSAVEAVRQESPYLFGTGRVFAENTGAAPHAGAVTQEALGAMSLAEYRRYRKGM